jgi:hypothetical protein
MPPASPSGEWQLVRRLYPSDEWALVTRGSRGLVDCAPVRAATKESVPTHSHPLPAYAERCFSIHCSSRDRSIERSGAWTPGRSSLSSASRTCRFSSGASRRNSSMILSTSGDATVSVPPSWISSKHPRTLYHTPLLRASPSTVPEPFRLRTSMRASQGQATLRPCVVACEVWLHVRGLKNGLALATIRIVIRLKHRLRRLAVIDVFCRRSGLRTGCIMSWVRPL